MIIKLGKVKYCVKEIYKESDTSQKQEIVKAHSQQTNEDQKHNSSEDKKESEEDHNNINIVTDEEKPQSALNVSPNINIEKALQDNKETNICRICQADDIPADNPLISPCKCSGSIKYIHVKCMQEWYKSKLVSRVMQNTTSYTIKGLECELCKQRFSMSIEHDGKIIDLVNVLRPKTGAYLVLESTGQIAVTHIHITAMENKRTIRMVCFINKRIGKRTR